LLRWTILISKCGHGKGVLLSPGFGHEKSREPKLDFLLGGAADGGLIFSYKWLPDNTVGSGTTGTGEISLMRILYPESLMEWGCFAPKRNRGAVGASGQVDPKMRRLDKLELY
jgi:hypothetical protein